MWGELLISTLSKNRNVTHQQNDLGTFCLEFEFEGFSFKIKLRLDHIKFKNSENAVEIITFGEK